MKISRLLPFAVFFILLFLIPSLIDATTLKRQLPPPPAANPPPAPPPPTPQPPPPTVQPQPPAPLPPAPLPEPKMEPLPPPPAEPLPPLKSESIPEPNLPLPSEEASLASDVEWVPQNQTIVIYLFVIPLPDQYVLFIMDASNWSSPLSNYHGDLPISDYVWGTPASEPSNNMICAASDHTHWQATPDGRLIAIDRTTTDTPWNFDDPNDRLAPMETDPSSQYTGLPIQEEAVTLQQNETTPTEPVVSAVEPPVETAPPEAWPEPPPVEEPPEPEVVADPIETTPPPVAVDDTPSPAEHKTYQPLKSDEGWHRPCTELGDCGDD